MEIEIKKTSKKKNIEFDILIKNEIIGYADFNFDGKEMFSFQIYEGNADKMFSYSVGDLFEIKTNYVALPIDFIEFPTLNWLGKYSVIVINANEPTSVYVQPNYLEWDKSISLKDFFIQLQNKVALKEDIDCDLAKHLENDNDDLDFTIEFLKIPSVGNIGNLYRKTFKQLDNITREIFRELDIEKHANTFTTIFRFPPEIQSACEQYLIYFSKFLEDLGIDAETSFESNKFDTLFKVIPKNSQEALSQIRDALDIYLNLPNAQNIENVSESFNDIGVQQLVANIYHLKSQLLLANSTIELKNATIESLKFSNYQMKTLDQRNKLDANEETVLDGILTIGQFEFKGLKLNLAELFRKIKRRLK